MFYKDKERNLIKVRFTNGLKKILKLRMFMPTFRKLLQKI
jgi:hypothetical protein